MFFRSVEISFHHFVITEKKKKKSAYTYTKTLYYDFLVRFYFLLASSADSRKSYGEDTCSGFERRVMEIKIHSECRCESIRTRHVCYFLHVRLCEDVCSSRTSVLCVLGRRGRSSNAAIVSVMCYFNKNIPILYFTKREIVITRWRATFEYSMKHKAIPRRKKFKVTAGMGRVVFSTVVK